MIIFITGKSGSGKSTFSKKLANKLKYKYIDVDAVGHKVYEIPEIQEKAFKLFGSSINDDYEKIDRKKLGQIVFNNRHSKSVKEFSDLTWEYMKNTLDKEITDNTIVDWILLPHTKYWKYKAFRILIKSLDENVRIKKILERDNITLEYAKLRDKASIEYDEKAFDFIIINTYEEKEINNYLQKIIKCINNIK